MGHSRQRALRGVLLSEAEQEDAQLVRASQRGDQEAFALLVRRHQRRIFNLSLGLLTDEKDASESTQEAFVAAWQGLPSFRGEARFATWLYRLAYQCGLRQLERRKREHALKAALQAEQDLVGIRTEQRVTDTTRRHDLQALVREQLEHLPLEDRTVLILRHLHDQTYEEIAAILSIPVGTVKTQLFRARTLLKERLTGTAPLVTRATMAGTPLTENEEVMHPSGQFHLQGREQDNTPDHQETDDFSQHQRAWLEQQHSALAQQEAWLDQPCGWLEQRRG